MGSGETAEAEVAAAAKDSEAEQRLVETILSLSPSLNRHKML